MKKILLVFGLLFSSFILYAQEGSISRLDDSLNYGNIVLGDSITNYLTTLSLLEEKGNGGFKCEANYPNDECFKIGELSPFAIYVDVENYIISSILVYFKLEECVDVLRAVTGLYGNSDRMDDDAVSYWYGKKANISLGVQGSKATFVIFMYDPKDS